MSEEEEEEKKRKSPPAGEGKGARGDEQLFSVLSRSETYVDQHRKASDQLSRAFLALAEARHLGRLEQIRPDFFAEDNTPAVLVGVEAAPARRGKGEGELPGVSALSLVDNKDGDEGWSGVQARVRSLRRAKDEFRSALALLVGVAREGSGILGEVGAIKKRGGGKRGGASTAAAAAASSSSKPVTLTASEPWEAAMREKAQTGKGAVVMQMMQQLGAALVVGLGRWDGGDGGRGSC